MGERKQCQICARLIKVTNRNELYNHGYKRPRYGFETGGCDGTGYVPYEVSNERLREVILTRQAYIEQLKETIARWSTFPPKEIKTENYKGNEVFYTRPDDFNAYSNKHSSYGYDGAWMKNKHYYNNELKSVEASTAWLIERYEQWGSNDLKLAIVGFITDLVVLCPSCTVGRCHGVEMRDAVSTGIMLVELLDSNGSLIYPILAKNGQDYECDKCHCKLAPPDLFDESLQMEINLVEDEMTWLDIQAEIEGAF